MSLHSEPVLRRSERRRALTNPAGVEYERKVERFHSKLCDIKADIRDCWNKIEESQSDVKTLDSLDKLLTEAYQAYQTESDKLCEYLKRMRTRDSEIEMSAHMLVRDTVMAKITVARNRISRLIKIEEPTGRSVQYSYRSLSQESLSSSNKTSIKSVIRRKEAKLEAQHARMEHLEEELEFEAKLKRLRARRDIKATTRESSVLKEEPPSPELASIKSGKTKTEEYLFNLPRYEAERRTYELLEEERKAPAPRPEPEVKFQEKYWAHPQQSFAYMHEPMVSKAQLNPGALDFVPREAPQPPQSQVIDIFTKHLVKRDLILSRLSKFNDDDPMMYVSWKLGFQGIMTELGASDTEVLELLCEKLGTNSSKQAKTIKACNANNPAAAIVKIWERLDRRFGAAEQVEKYIHKKICDFPEVTTDKYHLLYDLVDLATEIASVKSQPQFEILFSYFDSKKGVNELVDKLPWNLKEKWTTEATRYKRNAAVVYPPFSVFLKFLEDMAEMKNDPAFSLRKVVNRDGFFTNKEPRGNHMNLSQEPLLLPSRPGKRKPLLNWKCAPCIRIVHIC